MDEESPLTANLLQEKENDDVSTLHASQDEPIEGSENINSSGERTWQRGELQPKKFRDVNYAIIFLAQFLFIAIYSIVQYFKSNDDNGWQDGSINTFIWNNQFIPLILIPIAISVLLIFASFLILTKMGEKFITWSVWMNVWISAVIAVLAFAGGQIFLGAMCLLSTVIGACYAIAVRPRIPFAAANLDAGVSAIQSNLGVFFVPFLSGIFVCVYLVLWTISLESLAGVNEVCTDDGNTCDIDISRSGWIFPWVFLLFWTIQVVKFGIHTIVAGVVATWFFDPTHASSCCSKAVVDSTRRSLTLSFGSICLGSLLVAIVQFLDWIVRSIRQSRAESRESGAVEALFLCCLDCILQMIEGMMQYFNKWAFIYVAVYGYPYFTAGEKVMNLFEQRGWTIIINDNLVSNALGLLSFSIALLNGIASSIVAHFVLVNPENAQIVFWSSFGIGLLIAFTMMSILDSSVSTVVLCFAESPQDFEEKHEAHSRKMCEAWNKVYPMIRF